MRIVARDEKGNDVVADVSIDGKAVGKTPFQGTYIVGRHAIKVEATDTGIWEGFLNVAQGEKQEVIAVLTKSQQVGPKTSWHEVSESVYFDERNERYWLTSDGLKKTWHEAVEYCDDLDYGGYTDWRLPNKDELKNAFDNALGYRGDDLGLDFNDYTCVWTGSANPIFSWNAYYIYKGTVYSQFKTIEDYALCTR